MGCNCIFEYSNINNDITIEITSNHNYKVYKKKSTKNNEEIIIRSIIDDYKALNKNATKFKLNEKNVANKIRKIQVPKKTQYNQRITKKNKKIIFRTKQGINKYNILNNEIDSATEKEKERKNAKPRKRYIKVKKTHPERITYLKDITKDSFSYFYLDNTFVVFTSINNILTLIYTTKDKSIVSFDLIDNKKINTIKGAHKELITNLRHNLDKTNKKDLLLSISYDSNIKLWD